MKALHPSRAAAQASITDCPVCGAPRDDGDPACRFDVPEEQAPWRGDYEAMSNGTMTHADHQVLVARWAMHRAHTLSEKAREAMARLAAGNRGRHVSIPVDGH